MALSTEDKSIKRLLMESQHQVFNILHDAGIAIMQHYHTISKSDISYKSDNSPVTAADLDSNKIITEGLLALFPDIPVISEEVDLLPYQVRKTFEYSWILDPLDGTKEFLNKTDEFCINLALVHKRKPIAGYIYLPAKNKLYYAYSGHGAYEWKETGPDRMYCSKFNLQEEGLRVVVSRSHMDPLTRLEIDRLRKPKKIVLGSALKFISIAKGEADYYPRMIHIMEWDTAAGQILIEEAGGSLEDALTGKPLEYNKQSLVNPYFIASGIVQ